MEKAKKISKVVSDNLAMPEIRTDETDEDNEENADERGVDYNKAVPEIRMGRGSGVKPKP